MLAYKAKTMKPVCLLCLVLNLPVAKAKGKKKFKDKVHRRSTTFILRTEKHIEVKRKL